MRSRLPPQAQREATARAASRRRVLRRGSGVSTAVSCSVEAVSGMGLMMGLKTVKPAGEVVKACMDNGVLCLTAKDKVRLLPALNIPMAELEKAAKVIKEACK